MYNNKDYKIKGYKGTWYIIADAIYRSKKYYKLESCQYGDETMHLIAKLVDGDMIGLYQTYDPIHEALEEMDSYDII